MGSPVQGILDWGQKVRALPQKFLNTVTAPVDYANNEIHSLTGHYIPGVPPPPYTPPAQQPVQQGSMISARKAKR